MDRPVPQLSLKEQRERTVLALCDHFAADRLEMADFEARLDGAHRATTGAELQALVADLPALTETPPPPRSTASDVLARGTRATVDTVRETRTLVAFMGGVERKGHWTPARRNLVVAIMGGAGLDFREVTLPPGETEVVLFCFMGGAEIIVPPGLNVDANGIAIMGGFEHASPPRGTDPDAPVLKLTGVAIMGGVEIVVRHPGESGKDARQRERDERQDRQRRLRDKSGDPGTDR